MVNIYIYTILTMVNIYIYISKTVDSREHHHTALWSRACCRWHLGHRTFVATSGPCASGTEERQKGVTPVTNVKLNTRKDNTKLRQTARQTDTIIIRFLCVLWMCRSAQDRDDIDDNSQWISAGRWTYQHSSKHWTGKRRSSSGLAFHFIFHCFWPFS